MTMALYGIRFRSQVPVLYQTKWARRTSPLAAKLALSVNGGEGACKTLVATLNLYDVTLR